MCHLVYYQHFTDFQQQRSHSFPLTESICPIVQFQNIQVLFSHHFNCTSMRKHRKSRPNFILTFKTYQGLSNHKKVFSLMCIWKGKFSSFIVQLVLKIEDILILNEKLSVYTYKNSFNKNVDLCSHLVPAKRCFLLNRS